MKYFFVYYMNLMFSALSADDQRAVIDKCFEPLLDLSDLGLKFGIQISGVSLEIIADYRPDLIERLAELIDDEKVDFIGNGYAQVIQPLFPTELNQKNQLIGIQAYEKYLGVRPNICTVNEMAYSRGSCESMLHAGYDTLLMESNNVAANDEEGTFQSLTPGELTVGDKNVDVLWCDTIAFQKFQKYVHGEIELEGYFEWLEEYVGGKTGSLCLYCSDAEIFGFRPARYGTEITPTLDEWRRVELLMSRVTEATVLPSSLKDSSTTPVSLTNAAHPIVVKKQQKYNINRWALTGRDDQALNTFCHRLTHHAIAIGDGFSNENWKDLLKLASSDLRTHIEEVRWTDAREIKANFVEKFGDRLNSSFRFPEVDSCLEASSVNLDRKRGNNIVSWPDYSPVLGRVESGVFKQARLMADFYSGYALVEKLGHRKFSDLDFERADFNTSAYNEYKGQSGYSIKKKIESVEPETLDVYVSITVPSRAREQIKPCHFTFTPDSWDRETLYYSAKLGGNEREEYFFGSKSFDHDNILNLNVVGTNGFCPTDGVLIIGDKNQSLQFVVDQAICFCLVRLTYDVESDGRFLLRVSFVIQDIDETFREDAITHTHNFHCSIRRHT